MIVNSRVGQLLFVAGKKSTCGFSNLTESSDMATRVTIQNIISSNNTSASPSVSENNRQTNSGIFISQPNHSTSSRPAIPQNRPPQRPANTYISSNIQSRNFSPWIRSISNMIDHTVILHSFEKIVKQIEKINFKSAICSNEVQLLLSTVRIALTEADAIKNKNNLQIAAASIELIGILLAYGLNRPNNPAPQGSPV